MWQRSQPILSRRFPMMRILTLLLGMLFGSAFVLAERATDFRRQEPIKPVDNHPVGWAATKSMPCFVVHQCQNTLAWFNALMTTLGDWSNIFKRRDDRCGTGLPSACWDGGSDADNHGVARFTR